MPPPTRARRAYSVPDFARVEAARLDAEKTEKAAKSDKMRKAPTARTTTVPVTRLEFSEHEIADVVSALIAGRESAERAAQSAQAAGDTERASAERERAQRTADLLARSSQVILELLRAAKNM
jgi:hypothetical protein